MSRTANTMARSTSAKTSVEALASDDSFNARIAHKKDRRKCCPPNFSQGGGAKFVKFVYIDISRIEYTALVSGMASFYATFFSACMAVGACRRDAPCPVDPVLLATRASFPASLQRAVDFALCK